MPPTSCEPMPCFCRAFILADMFFCAKRNWQEAARQFMNGSINETNILISNERLRYGVLLAAARRDTMKQGAQLGFRAACTFPTETPRLLLCAGRVASPTSEKRCGNGSEERTRFSRGSTAWFARPLFDLGWLKTSR